MPIRVRIIFLSASILLAGHLSNQTSAFSAESNSIAESDLSLFLNNLNHKLSHLTSLKFDFIQERQLQGFKKKLVTKGRASILFPDKLRWETISPHKSLVISNQNLTNQFEFKQGNWVILDLRSTQIFSLVFGHILSWTRGEFSKSMKDFHITLAKPGTLNLEPIDSDIRKNHIAKIALTIDLQSSIAKQVTMTDGSGDLTSIFFENLTINEILAPELFDSNSPRIQ